MTVIGNSISRLRTKSIGIYRYCVDNVWQDTNKSPLVNLVKILNLSVGSFLNKDLQKKAAALTYHTLLAIIPTLAMLFAIGRGFGLQNLLQLELLKYFPAQADVLNQSFVFVENYLNQSSGGLFLGIGLIFLFATLYGLMCNVENIFNEIWGVRKGRSVFRRLTDYAATFLFLPILIICEGGISIYLKTFATDSLLSPIAILVLKSLPFILSWIFFASAFVIIPNTKVKISNAIVAGAICSVGFQILQWMFISGQVYVSKYNAIYGSFAFLPLFMVWIQLSWTLALGGVVLTYSTQNIFTFNFHNHIEDISLRYFHTITIVILSIIVKRFNCEGKAYSESELAEKYDLPIKLVNLSLSKLIDSNLITTLEADEKGIHRFQPATDIEKYTLSFANTRLYNEGKDSFLSAYDTEQKGINSILNLYSTQIEKIGENTLLKDLDISLK